MTISTSHYVSVNIGSVANDGTGDDLRTAFNKVNQNFANIETIGTPVGNLVASGTIQCTDSTVSNSLSVSGLLTTSGARADLGIQQYKPTANIAVTANVNVQHVLLHPTGTFASFGANITLPNTSINGTVVRISSNVTIASLDVRSGWNGVISVSPFGNISSVATGTSPTYMYISNDAKWYRIG